MAWISIFHATQSRGMPGLSRGCLIDRSNKAFYEKPRFSRRLLQVDVGQSFLCVLVFSTKNKIATIKPVRWASGTGTIEVLSAEANNICPVAIS